MPDNAADPTEHRQEITAILARLEARLLTPLAEQSWHNLAPFLASGFDLWLAELECQTDIPPYLPEQTYRSLYRQGRINDADLNAAFAQQTVLHTAKPLPKAIRESFFRVILQYDLPCFNSGYWPWQNHELKALKRMQADAPEAVRKNFLLGSSQADAAHQLWQALCTQLALPETAPSPAETTVDNPATLASRHDQTRQHATRELDLMLAEIGPQKSLPDFVLALSGHDTSATVHAQLLCILGPALGFKEPSWRWPNVAKTGLYPAWRATIAFDAGLLLHQLPDWQEIIADLPEHAADCIHQQLLKLGIPKNGWEGYLLRLAVNFPDCLHWVVRLKHLETGRYLTLTDYLAIRLVLDRLWLNQVCQELWQVEAKISTLTAYFRKNLSEFLVRKHLYQGQLPEQLATLAEALILRAGSERHCRSDWQKLADLLHCRQASDSFTHDGWRLFRLCQHAGLSALTVEHLERNELLSLLPRADAFTADERGKIWLYAFEHHYRQQLAAALTANTQAISKRPARLPLAQAVFCLDNREEGLRRHLEALSPNIETFGSNGFLAHAPLLPAGRRHTPLPRVLRRWQQRLGLAGAFLAINAIAPIALLSLIGQSLWPQTQRALTRWLKAKITQATASQSGTSQATNSLEDKHAQAASFLQDIGLTANIADWVLLLGHASLDDPASQAVCQACQGRCHGHNAETLATLLNQTATRALLLARGIVIPETTRFVAAEHDGNGLLHWRYCPQQPASAALQALQSNLQQALRLSVQERQQKETGADRHPNKPPSHSGQAAWIIGRRQLSYGLALNSRVFLSSYDADQDPDGNRLQDLLQTGLPRLVGINLDHYLASTQQANKVNNQTLANNPGGLFTLTPGTCSDYRYNLTTTAACNGHEALRLSIVVETRLTVMAALLRREAQLDTFFTARWAYLSVIDVHTGRGFEYLPGTGFQEI